MNFLYLFCRPIDIYNCILHMYVMIDSHCSVMKQRITMMMIWWFFAGISWQVSWGGNWGNASWPHLPVHRDSDTHTVSHLSSSLWTHLEASGKGLFLLFYSLGSRSAAAYSFWYLSASESESPNHDMNSQWSSGKWRIVWMICWPKNVY